MKFLWLNKVLVVIVLEFMMMVFMKYKICYFLNWNDVGYNVVVFKRVFFMLWRVS